MKVVPLPDKPVIVGGESWRKAAHASVASAIKSTVGDGWQKSEPPNNGEGSWIPAPPSNGEGLCIEADPPEVASADFEEDNWQLIAEHTSLGDKNDGFMLMGEQRIIW